MQKTHEYPRIPITFPLYFFYRIPKNPIWEFPKIRGTLFWGPYNKDPTI